MAARLTPEERLEAWLAAEAVGEGFTGEVALRYMDAMRNSLVAQRQLAGYRSQEAVAAIGVSVREALEGARRFGERMRKWHR